MKYVSEWTAQDEAGYQRLEAYRRIYEACEVRGLTHEDADAAARQYDMVTHGEGDVSLDELLTGSPAQNSII